MSPNKEGIMELSEENQTIILKYLYDNCNQFKEWFLDSLSTMILTIFKKFNDIVIENNPVSINEEVCKFMVCEDNVISQKWKEKVLKLNTRLNTPSVEDEEKVRLLSNALSQVFDTYSYEYILWSDNWGFIITSIIKLIILKSNDSNIALQLVYNSVNILPRLEENFITFLNLKLSPHLA